MLDRLIRLASSLRNTPLHPQWLVFRRTREDLRDAWAGMEGTVLDIGCADGYAKQLLPMTATYVGLDYYSTATDWYNTEPDVFGDAQSLPVADSSIDHALLLDVLEHLPHPDQCIAELHRVLKQGGSLTLQVPFMYPLHDEPLDFHRWTLHGLRAAAERHGYSIESEEAVGHPLETAALNTNIAFSKTVINWARHGNPLALFGLLLPPAVFVNNVLARLFTALSRKDDLMPHGYRVVWIRR